MTSDTDTNTSNHTPSTPLNEGALEAAIWAYAKAWGYTSITMKSKDGMREAIQAYLTALPTTLGDAEAKTTDLHGRSMSNTPNKASTASPTNLPTGDGAEPQMCLKGTATGTGFDSQSPDHKSSLVEANSFQRRVEPWMRECFGDVIPFDKAERNHRFIEEALELVQSCGATASECHQLVDYVFNRPSGEPHQESGGVMVTHAALCLANGLDMHDNGEVELARIWKKIETIRAKQAAKPKHSPLPHESSLSAAANVDDAELKRLGKESLKGLMCLYAQCPDEVVKDVHGRVGAYIDALHAAIAALTTPNQQRKGE